jgi:thioredoxin-like negative regulator of GroEL
MQKLDSIHQIKEQINSGAKLLYISAPNCNVCDVLKVKVEKIVKEQFPKIELYEANVAEIPQISAEFNIFSAPAILIFFDGQEFVREGRNVSLELLEDKISKIYKLYFN